MPVLRVKLNVKDKMDIVSNIFCSAILLLLVDLFIVKYYDHCEKSYGLKTPDWVVKTTGFSFLVLAGITVISALIIIWGV